MCKMYKKWESQEKSGRKKWLKISQGCNMSPALDAEEYPGLTFQFCIAHLSVWYCWKIPWDPTPWPSLPYNSLALESLSHIIFLLCNLCRSSGHAFGSSPQKQIRDRRLRNWSFSSRCYCESGNIPSVSGAKVPSQASVNCMYVWLMPPNQEYFVCQ